MIYLTFVFGAKHSWYQSSKNFSVPSRLFRFYCPHALAREKIVLLITCTSNCFNRLFSAWLKLVKNFYSAFFVSTLWMYSRFTSTSWSEMFGYIKMLVLCLLIVSFLHFPYGEENEARVSFEINRPKRSPCVIGTRWRTRRCRVSQRKVSIVESQWVFWTDSNLPSVQLVFGLQLALALTAL